MARKMPLQKKGEGCAIHVSDFIIEQMGQIALLERLHQENAALPVEQHLTHTDACEIIYPGKNNDGWWNMERFIVLHSIALTPFC